MKIKTKPKVKKPPKINPTVDSIIPISYYDTDLQAYVCKDDSIVDIVQFVNKDLASTNSIDVEMDILDYTRFYRKYAGDIKIISNNSPADCREQINYFSRKIDQCRNETKKKRLQNKKTQLEWLERNRLTKEFFLVYFSKNQDQHIENKKAILNSLKSCHKIKEIDRDKKDAVWFRLNNKNLKSILEMPYYPKGIHEKKELDPYLIERIQPQGGISFKYEGAIRTGTGYEACIHIYDFPAYLDTHWLTRICNISETSCIIDISTDDIAEVKKNLNRSIREQKSRTDDGDHAEKRDAFQRQMELERHYDEVSFLGEIIKLVHIRIYVSAITIAKLEEKIESVQHTIYSDDFKASIFLNEEMYEWKSMYIPYSEQKKYSSFSEGQPLTGEALAAGNPFHFSQLSDPFGSYFGYTPCIGNFNFYMFTNTNQRMSYNALVTGGMGSGKSTILKAFGADAYSRGDFVRMFDVSNECKRLAEALGGRSINLDGTDGGINPFDIMKTHENEATCFSNHLSKMVTEYKIWAGLSENSNEEKQEIITFENYLKDLYISFHILPENGEIDAGTQVTGLPSKRYPIAMDFSNFLMKRIEQMESESSNGSISARNQREIKRLDNIQRVISRLAKNYGQLFNVHTSIDNIMDVPFIAFNIKTVLTLDAPICDSILFNTLYLCWDNATRNGLIMKERYEAGQIAREDVSHMLIIFDEFHRMTNAKKTTTLQQLTQMMREMRKFFAGLLLATQNISDLVPAENELNTTDSKLIQDIFTLSTYKFIGKQDPNQLDTMRRAFKDALTESEYRHIPRQEKGEFIVNMSGDSNLSVKIYVDPNDLDLFSGGV